MDGDVDDGIHGAGDVSCTRAIGGGFVLHSFLQYALMQVQSPMGAAARDAGRASCARSCLHDVMIAHD
jgi:hypothetical protein